MNLIYIKLCFTFAHKNNNNERYEKNKIDKIYQK